LVSLRGTSPLLASIEMVARTANYNRQIYNGKNTRGVLIRIRSAKFTLTYILHLTHLRLLIVSGWEERERAH